MEPDEVDARISHIAQIKNKLSGNKKSGTQGSTAVKSNGLQDYYDNVLCPQYGAFQSPQTKTIYSPEDYWLKTDGILGYTIWDFDGDSCDEMLVVLSSPVNNNESQIDLIMYEANGEEVIEQARTPMKEYANKTMGSNVIGARVHPEELIGITVLSSYSAEAIGQGPVILCEYQFQGAIFASGQYAAAWGMTYDGIDFSYVMSYIQEEGGSSDFIDVGYVYNPALNRFNSTQCYSEAEYYSGKGASREAAL